MFHIIDHPESRIVERLNCLIVAKGRSDIVGILNF